MESESTGIGENSTKDAAVLSTGRYGAGGQDRTGDILITSQVLYQLSYTGLSLVILARGFRALCVAFEASYRCDWIDAHAGCGAHRGNTHAEN